MIRRPVILLLVLLAPGGLAAQDFPSAVPDLAYPRPSAVAGLSQPSSHVLGGVHVSSLGLAGTAAFSLGDRRERTTELVIAFGRANSSYVPTALINGTLYAQALHVVPVYLGLRFTLARGGTSPLSWNWYVRGGAGPALGLLTPMGLEFFDALRASTFHWGLGVYAATGLEFVVDNSFAFFVQLGAEGIGFFPVIEGRSALLGPSVTFGVGRLFR